MAAPAVGRVALMSIHPQYAEAKRVEFCKRPITADVTHVIVYATAPVSAIVGAFTVACQQTTSPSALRKRYSLVGGISRVDFFGYFATHATGTGIQVDTVLTPDDPLELSSWLGVPRPPQSFQYVEPTYALDVLDAMQTA